MKNMITSPTAKLYSFDTYLEIYGYLLYTNVGISMLPLLRQRRDIIEIRRRDLDKRCEKYDVVLYKRRDKYILHRVLKVRDKDYVICGDHNVRKEYGITDEMILGVMTRVIRNGRSIYTTDRKYKLYVHLWCDFYPVRAVVLYAVFIAKAAGHCVKKLLFRKNKETDE